MATADFLSLLKEVKGSSGSWTALCPAHEDRSPSLSVREGRTGEPVVTCHAGCDWRSVFEAVGYRKLSQHPGFSGGHSTVRREVAVYEYTDADGRYLYEVVRFVPKQFMQRRRRQGGGFDWSLGDVPLVPFRLPKVIAQARAGGRVYVVEGEKDVLTLESLGLVATTNAGGAGKWQDSWSGYFRGSEVVILPDNDDAGRRHAESVGRALKGPSRGVRIATLPGLSPKGDVTDWVATGGTVSQLEAMASGAASASSGPLTAADDSTSPKLLTLRSLFDDEDLLTPAGAVIPPFLYSGRVTMISAREKVGKTTFAASAAARLSQGRPFLNTALEPGTTLWFTLDESLKDTVQRFRALDAHPDRFILSVDRPNAAQLKKILEDTRPVLVVIDTINELLAGVNLNKGEDVGPALRPFVDVMRAANVAALILAHAGKGSGEYLGSVRIGALVDAPLTLRSPLPRSGGSNTTEFAEDAEADGPRLLSGKTRWAGKLSLRLTFDGTGYVLGEEPMPLPAKILREVNSACLSFNDLQSRLVGKRQRLLDEVNALIANGLIERVSGKLSITPSGLRALDVGIPTRSEVVPAILNEGEPGTTLLDLSMRAGTTKDDAGDSPSKRGTTREPAKGEWFPQRDPYVEHGEPAPNSASLSDDLGPIDGVA